MNSMNIHNVTAVKMNNDSSESEGSFYAWKNVVIRTSDGVDFRLTLFPKEAGKMFEITLGEPE